MKEVDRDRMKRDIEIGGRTIALVRGKKSGRDQKIVQDQGQGTKV
jgi:hypothetical protein